MKADTLTRVFCLLLAAFISSYNADASGKLSTEDVRIIIVETPVITPLLWLPVTIAVL